MASALLARHRDVRSPGLECRLERSFLDSRDSGPGSVDLHHLKVFRPLFGVSIPSVVAIATSGSVPAHIRLNHRPLDLGVTDVPLDRT
jgi:hypothetical protein